MVIAASGSPAQVIALVRNLLRNSSILTGFTMHVKRLPKNGISVFGDIGIMSMRSISWTENARPLKKNLNKKPKKTSQRSKHQ